MRGRLNVKKNQGGRIKVSCRMYRTQHKPYNDWPVDNNMKAWNSFPFFVLCYKNTRGCFVLLTREGGGVASFRRQEGRTSQIPQIASFILLTGWSPILSPVGTNTKTHCKAKSESHSLSVFVLWRHGKDCKINVGKKNRRIQLLSQKPVFIG